MRQFTGMAYVYGKRHSSFNVTFTPTKGSNTWTAQFGSRQNNAKVTGVTMPDRQAACETTIIKCLRAVLGVDRGAKITIPSGSWIRFN